MNACLGQTTALRRFARLTQDTVQWTRIHTFGVNCLKASIEKEKQPNWNKTNEMNICLVSTTIFLGKKEHWFCISKHHDKPILHDNVLSIIDKA